MDRVRMSTFVNASGQNLAKASHFDTAFVMEDLPLHKLEDGLSGMFLEFILQYQVVFQGPVRSGFLAFFGQDRDRTGLQKFPFWEKIEPDWENPVYIGPVLDICQL